MAQQRGQARQNVPGACHLTGRAVTDANGQRWCRVVVVPDLEVVVETGDFKDLGHGDIHFVGQRHQVALEQCTVLVVQGVQVLNQQVAPVAVCWPLADQGAHLIECLCFNLPAFERVEVFFTQTLTQVV